MISVHETEKLSVTNGRRSYARFCDRNQHTNAQSSYNGALFEGDKLKATRRSVESVCLFVGLVCDLRMDARSSDSGACGPAGGPGFWHGAFQSDHRDVGKQDSGGWPGAANSGRDEGNRSFE